MTDRERLIELISQIQYMGGLESRLADHLLANGVTVQKWISVKDRLPEENERVLACYINPFRKDRPPRMMAGEGALTQIVKGKVYLWCGGWHPITHWMPLPNPPKRKQKKS